MLSFVFSVCCDDVRMCLVASCSEVGVMTPANTEFATRDVMDGHSMTTVLVALEVSHDHDCAGDQRKIGQETGPFQVPGTGTVVASCPVEKPIQ